MAFFALKLSSCRGFKLFSLELNSQKQKGSLYQSFQVSFNALINLNEDRECQEFYEEDFNGTTAPVPLASIFYRQNMCDFKAVYILFI